MRQNANAAVGMKGPQLERSGGFESSPANRINNNAALRILTAIAAPPALPRETPRVTSFADEKCKPGAREESPPAARQSKCPRSIGISPRAVRRPDDTAPRPYEKASGRLRSREARRANRRLRTMKQEPSWKAAWKRAVRGAGLAAGRGRNPAPTPWHRNPVAGPRRHSAPWHRGWHVPRPRAPKPGDVPFQCEPPPSSPCPAPPPAAANGAVLPPILRVL